MFRLLSSRARLAAATLAVGLLGTLAACGDSTPTVAAPAASIAASGTAAVGAPLANATVSLLCGKGGAPTTAKTAADGTFGMTLDSGCAAPYLLKVVGVDTSVTPNATVTLFAFADAAGNINITPLTDIAAGIVTGGNTSDLYDAVVKASKKVSDSWTDAAKKDATDKLKAKLADLGLDGDVGKVTVDLLQGKFKADGKDPLDALLDKLKIKRGSVSLSSLVEGIVQAGGQPGTQPWNVLFPSGASTMTLVGTGCSFGTPNPAYMPGMYVGDVWMPGTGGDQRISTNLTGSATLTLTKGTSSLSISASSGTTLFTVTGFTVGGTTGGNFGFELGYSASGFSSVSAYAGSDRSSFLYNAGKDKKLVALEAPRGEESSSANFNVYWPSATTNPYESSNSLSCQTVTPFAPGKFDLPSRVATIVKGVTTTVASPSAQPCVSQTYVVSSNSSWSYGTFSYSVSPVGEVMFNGTSLGSSFPSPATQAYSESTYFTSTGVPSGTSAQIVQDTSSSVGLTLRRSYGAPGSDPASFGHSCGRGGLGD